MGEQGGGERGYSSSLPLQVPANWEANPPHPIKDLAWALCLHGSFWSLALLNLRTSRGALDCSFLAGLRRAEVSGGPLPLAHPQGVDSQPAPEILKWPLALRRRTGTPGSSWAQLLPSRATEQLMDKLSPGDPTTQKGLSIWLLKGVSFF